MNARLLLAALAAFAAVPAMTAHAVVVQPVPDIFSDTTAITYTVSGNTGHLTATGTAERLRTVATDLSLTPNLTGGNFTLDADFTLSGNTITGVSGDVTVKDASTTYFTSNTLTGFNNASDTFTFNFGGNSGNYPGLFTVVLHGQGSTNFTNFGTAFSNTIPMANSDTYSVPEPASLSMLGLGGMLLLRRRKARA
ncbi:MAG TPA: PEP-CTERM sorting domain-containing protein [Phycisphaerae bacterium]|jgi:hypothetical protein|nr:PEP-CTERM sorting domain-containing protein [Phycisphaerae bacterium]